MKTLRSIQITLIALLCYFLIIDSPPKLFAKEKEVIAQRGRRGRGYRRGGVRFRFYVYPRRDYYYRDRAYYYYTNYQLSVTVRENAAAGMRIRDVFIDGYRIALSPASPNGNRGTYYYRINPGYHTVEWNVEMPNGQTQRFRREFYVDRYNQYTNIFIDGDQLYFR